MKTVFYKSDNFLIFSEYINNQRNVRLVDNIKLRNFSLDDMQLDNILQRINEIEKINKFGNNEDRKAKTDITLDYYIENNLV